jgi:hypothetical protein
LLNIHHISGYTPVVGDTVRILRNLVNGVTLGGVAVSDPHWQPIVAASGTEIHLTYVASAGIAGDYNNNGTVDAADYVVWRKNEGPNASLPNDNNLGNQAARFSLWRANFGKPPGAGSGGGLLGGSVPEPTSIVLVGLFACVSLALQRSRHGKQ